MVDDEDEKAGDSGMDESNSDAPTSETDHPLPMSPPEIVELAEGCVRFVEKAVGVKLDYTAETLPLLDHYLSVHRNDLRARPDAAGLVARAAGAYLGEVVRGRYRSFWSTPSDDPSTWQVQLEPVFLSFCPVIAVGDAITFGDDGGASSLFDMEDDDLEQLEAKLAHLPQVTEEEFYALSTRIEILDIAVSTIKAKMVDTGLGEVAFAPSDYIEERR